MKTKELKEIAEKNGYEFNVDGCSIFLIKEIQIYGRTFKNVIKINRLACKSIWINNSEYVGEMDVNMMEASIAYAKTPEEDREEPKRYIIPLPDLTTTDGEQLYLTHKDGHWFTCCRKQGLRQTWKKKHLCYVPEQYRGYAVEVEE